MPNQRRGLLVGVGFFSFGEGGEESFSFGDEESCSGVVVVVGGVLG
jgi:hypothetical protein